MKSTIISNAMDVLKENFRMSNSEIPFQEYCELEAKNDPKFYNWLFGSEADNINDFGIGMTEEQNQEAAQFFGQVKVESNYLKQINEEEKSL